MKAVIMAGGKGTRLRPLTCHVPKPMVPLTGRPCMEYIIDLLKTHGISDIAVTVQYLPDVIRDYFGDGSEFGVRLHYFEETAPLGTAGSVKNAESFLDETFIVISGDALTDFDLTDAVRFHRHNRSLSTLVLTQAEHPLEYGVVMTDPEGRIIRFLEKPSWGEVFSDTVNTGIYILEPDILRRMEPGIEYDFSTQLFPGLLAEQKPLFGYVASGYWSDIGNLQQYRQTQFDMLDGRVKVAIRGKQMQPGIYIGKDVTAGANVKWIGPAYIGDGSRIDDGVEIGEYCIVGKNNVLAKDSVLGRSILWDHNHIAEKNELLGSTLASRILCKESSQLADGSVVGSHCVLGPRTVVQPGVKIWPKKQIREHSRLNSSFIWGDHAGKTLYKSFGVAGMPNVEMTPEFAARFATAYGATLAAGKTITVSSSHNEFARMLKRTAAAALQSVGVHVVDIGDVLPPVARFAVRELQTAGGLHVQLGDARSECRFECYDEQGLPIGKAAERKVENSYWQEDYARAAAGAVGSYRTEDKLAEAYLKAVLATTAFAPAEDSRFRIVVSTHPGVFGLLRPLLNQLHCELVHLPAELQRDQLGETTRALGADLGLWLDDDGRAMALYTSEGERIADDRLTVLQYISFFHSSPGARIGAPGSAPMLLDSLAEGLGCMLIRTKESMRSIMEASSDLGFHPLFDGMLATGLILQNMNRSGLSIQHLLELIPSFYLQRERIDCPWDRKGLVMRKLMQEAQDRQVELLDGIKFYHDGETVLLLPDSDDPIFNLIAQGDHPERLAALVHQYREQILNFLQ
ncbi:sugar phosphate nucleotidyltransferase [Paenibacillus allorhizosphaerae]|uniref:UTP--glucose-1-phosphate uridylyltransferase n=1 Tax=Paenibacillus allorhizosphaerae TaxID=2849866 RepID=A0ABN7TQT7_9BACL|nr:sugar phosphate nucleotidyltransferase [Paenibacillus allorhizosphaerae]CAG7646659.1 UTP--glucose-1-phosphate uridylyltransferase [Paenibacillus allorhizosphaerae]